MEVGTIPVRLHWSVPIGALALGGFRFAPVFWVAFLVLLLVHEFGHAVVALRFGQRVTGIEVTGFGGVCRWTGDAGEYERGAISWGGVVAQLVLAAATHLVITFTGPAESAVAIDVVRALVNANLVLVAINLLPFPPLDGSEAWPWLGARISSWRRLQNARRLNHDTFDMDSIQVAAVEVPAIAPSPMLHDAIGGSSVADAEKCGSVAEDAPDTSRSSPHALRSAPPEEDGAGVTSTTSGTTATRHARPAPRPPIKSDAELAVLLRSIAEEAAKRRAS